MQGFQDRRGAKKYATEMLKEGFIKHTMNKNKFREQCYYVFGDVVGYAPPINVARLRLDDNEFDGVENSYNDLYICNRAATTAQPELQPPGQPAHSPPASPPRSPEHSPERSPRHSPHSSPQPQPLLFETFFPQHSNSAITTSFLSPARHVALTRSAQASPQPL